MGKGERGMMNNNIHSTFIIPHSAFDMTPKLAALLPVEDALQSTVLPDRRLTLHRIYFDLYAPSFPANARIPVAAVFCGGAGEYSAAVQLLDPAGREAARVDAGFTAAALHVHVFVLRCVLSMTGEYTLNALLEGEVVNSLPLIVAQTQLAPAITPQPEMAM